MNLHGLNRIFGAGALWALLAAASPAAGAGPQGVDAAEALPDPLVLEADLTGVDLEVPPRPPAPPSHAPQQRPLPEWVRRRAVMFGAEGDWEVGVGARSGFGLMVERQFR